MAEIIIKAQGASQLPLEEFVPIQGNLKDLSDDNYAKLHNLIVSKGFDSPIQVWKNPATNQHLILDGHQRYLVLTKLKEEGWTIPFIPIDLIEADSYKDAKERLLTKVSVYGNVTDDGLDAFLNEPDAIIEPDFGELLDIPGIDFDKPDTEEKPKREPKEIECPNCQHRFYPKGA